jgi:hypothetical protein
MKGNIVNSIDTLIELVKGSWSSVTWLFCLNISSCAQYMRTHTISIVRLP